MKVLLLGMALGLVLAFAVRMIVGATPSSVTFAYSFVCGFVGTSVVISWSDR